MKFTIGDIQTLVQKEYDRLWKSWFPGNSPIQPATIDVRIGDCSAGYSRIANRILICVAEGNFGDIERHIQGQSYVLSKVGWYVHQTELVHETIHEYADKVIQSPSVAGKTLYSRFKNHFAGPGHDEKFFTAVAEKAAFFGLTPEEFIREL